MRHAAPRLLAAAALSAGLAFAAAPAGVQTTIRVASFTPEGAVGVQHLMKP